MRTDFVDSIGPWSTDSQTSETNNQTNPGSKGDARDEPVKPPKKSTPKK